jgi:hypothetical protein
VSRPQFDRIPRRLIAWKRHRSHSGDGEPEDGAGETSADAGIAAKVNAEARGKAGRLSGRELWMLIALGRRPDPVPSYTGLVEDAEAGKVGIACSGGGIRSASFSLGALQSLQKEGVLEGSRYLSGVSGGAYIAGAFCMVRKTWSGDEPPPAGSAGHDDSDPRAVTEEQPPFFPGSPEEQYLRNRSSYLAPGFFDKLALGYRILLGLVFNLVVIGLFIVAVAVPLAALYGAMHGSLDQTISPCGETNAGCGFTGWPPPQLVWIAIGAIVVLGLVLGLLSLVPSAGQPGRTKSPTPGRCGCWSARRRLPRC